MQGLRRTLMAGQSSSVACVQCSRHSLGPGDRRPARLFASGPRRGLGMIRFGGRVNHAACAENRPSIAAGLILPINVCDVAARKARVAPRPKPSTRERSLPSVR
jgi:hypothetical protein